MLRWQHVVLGTRCAWLHGDERGFRDRRHRIDSSGDYKNRPPEGEHEGLHRYFKANSRDPVDFDSNVRILVCRYFVLKLKEMGIRVIAVSVGKRHLHALVYMVDDYQEKRLLIGRAKQRASHAVREILPGTIWAGGGKYKPVDNAPYLHNVFQYLRVGQEPGTVAWTHSPEDDWITDETVGVIMMVAKEQFIRVFPASRV
jgi:hypothetical protein